jgi:hypothetical protein
MIELIHKLRSRYVVGRNLQLIGIDTASSPSARKETTLPVKCIVVGRFLLERLVGACSHVGGKKDVLDLLIRKVVRAWEFTGQRMGIRAAAFTKV